jgi:hypothetical protein
LLNSAKIERFSYLHIVYLPWKILAIYATIANERLQNLGLYLAIVTFEQGKVFIVSRGLFFLSLTYRRQSHLATVYVKQWVLDLDPKGNVFWYTWAFIEILLSICSDETTKDVISMLLKKFHILDNPRKFALYEQELNEKGKIGRWI